jgi:hypothetical protein
MPMNNDKIAEIREGFSTCVAGFDRALVAGQYHLKRHTHGYTWLRSVKDTQYLVLGFWAVEVLMF